MAKQTEKETHFTATIQVEKVTKRIVIDDYNGKVETKDRDVERYAQQTITAESIPDLKTKIKYAVEGI